MSTPGVSMLGWRQGKRIPSYSGSLTKFASFSLHPSHSLDSGDNLSLSWPETSRKIRKEAESLMSKEIFLHATKQTL